MRCFSTYSLYGAIKKLTPLSLRVRTTYKKGLCFLILHSMPLCMEENPSFGPYIRKDFGLINLSLLNCSEICVEQSETITIFLKNRKENPQKLTQLSSRSHPRHLVGKRTAQKDITIDTTSDSQVNSNFPNRWSPASLTFNNYFYLFLYLYIK